jgi:alpha-1,2-mannosyltransferase
VGLARARQTWRCGDELAGVTLAGLTGCLVSPISWTHHLVWVVPAIVVLVDIAAGSGDRVRCALAGGAALAVAAVFGLSIIWYHADRIGNIHGTGPLVALDTNSYALVLLALVAFLPSRSRFGRAPSGAFPSTLGT